MGTLVLLLGGIVAAYFAYRWIRTSESDWAQVIRMLVWADERPRPRSH